jgi:hypothetical protein
MTSEFKERVYYGCQTHAGKYDFWCESCFKSAMSRLADEVEKIEEMATRLEQRFNGGTIE